MVNSINDPPIWNGTSFLDYASIVQTAPDTFRLYYTDADTEAINVASSVDGKNWTNIIEMAPNRSRQVRGIYYFPEGFTGIGSGNWPNSTEMHYRAWMYSTGHEYAESPDGILWYNIKPVTEYGTPIFDDCDVFRWGDVIYTKNATNTGTDWTFRMYFTKMCSSEPEELHPVKKTMTTKKNVRAFSPKSYYDSNPCADGNWSVYIAFSENGYNWTAYDEFGGGRATIVFQPSCNETVSYYDTVMIPDMKVIRNTPTDWEAFYAGASWYGEEYVSFVSINYATSTDGIHWYRSIQNPLMSSQFSSGGLPGFFDILATANVYSVVKPMINSYLVYVPTVNNSDSPASINIKLLEFSSEPPIVSSEPSVVSSETDPISSASYTASGISKSLKIALIIVGAELFITVSLTPVLIFFRVSNSKTQIV